MDAEGNLLSATVASWRRIPDELWLLIIEYTLRVDEPIDNICFTHLFNATVLPFIGFGPRLAGIAIEAFYTTNTFALTFRDASWAKHPKPVQNDRIQQLRMQLMSSIKNGKALTWFSKGNFGFSNVRELTLVVDGSILGGLLFKEKDLKKRKTDILLNVKKLIVKYIHRGLWSFDLQEDISLEKLRIHAPMAYAMKETYKKYYSDGRTKVYVHDWTIAPPPPRRGVHMERCTLRTQWY